MVDSSSQPPPWGVPAIARCVEQLHAALDQVAVTPGWSLGEAEQRETLVELDRAEARVAELRLRVLAVADRNHVGDASGAASTAAWYAHTTRQNRPRARAEVRLATALDQRCDITRAGLAEGRVTVDQARVIVQAVDRLPDRVTAMDRARAEGHLVEAAGEFDAKDLRVLGRRILEVIDPEAAEAEEARRLADEERRANHETRFSMRDNGDGTHTGRFTLPDLHAAILRTVLEALTAPSRTANHRRDADGQPVSYPRQLGQGLCELLEHLPTDRLPTSGGCSTRVVVTMDFWHLLDGLGAASLDTGGRITAGQARRLACTAGIIPMVLGSDSVPLDVGRTRRLYSEAQRLALARRYGGCAAADCDRPPGWCQAHHRTPWAAGGATSVDNGVLLCGHHHTLAHHPDYEAAHTPTGAVAFHRRQ